jgi:hypothetical protein
LFISAGDNTFSAGLIEALTQVLIEKNDVLLVAYDNVIASFAGNEEGVILDKAPGYQSILPLRGIRSR